MLGVWIVLRPAAEPQATTAIERLGVSAAHMSVVLMHLGKLIVPVRLAVLAFAPDTGWVIGGCAAAAMLGLGFVVRNRRVFLWGLGCFVAFVLPTLPVSDFLILENRLYVPAMGIMTAMVVAGSDLAERRTGARPLVAAAAACVVLAFSAMTLRYAESFRDPQRFTEAAVRTSPRLGLAHLNRGIVFHQEGRNAEAEAEYQQALALDRQVPVTHNNLGLIHMARGDLNGAERLFRAELQINPAYDKAHFNLGLALARQGRVPEASESWREAIRLNPENVDARVGLEQAERANEGAVPITSPSLQGVPTGDLVSLFEDALARDPANPAIRRAYREMCAQRGITCPRLADAQ